MRVIPALCAGVLGISVMASSMEMSENASMESCIQAFQSITQPPQAASGTIAAGFEAALKKFPGPCQPKLNGTQTANSVLAGIIVTFFSYIAFLLIGKVLRWAER